MCCAARCGPVHPTSPLSVCQRCSLSQCARRCCAPHRCWGGKSPVLRKCWSVRCSADMASARLRIVLDQPSPAARPGCRAVRGSCGARPLRQSYITPHCPQCPPVSRKLLLWQPPLRALRVKATGFMQNCLRWVRSHSRRRFPVVGTPYAPPSARPCGFRGTLASVRRYALCAWSVAYGQSCRVCPRPPTGASPLRGFGPVRRSARPPPVGAPSARALLHLRFTIGFVVIRARLPNISRIPAASSPPHPNSSHHSQSAFLSLNFLALSVTARLV